jgi:hypothetical protein
VDTPFAQVAPQVSGQVIAVEVRDNARTTQRPGADPDRPAALLKIALRDRRSQPCRCHPGRGRIRTRRSATPRQTWRSSASSSLPNNKLGRNRVGALGKAGVSETTAIRARSGHGHHERRRHACRGPTGARAQRTRRNRGQQRQGQAGTTLPSSRQSWTCTTPRCWQPADGVITNLRLSTGQFVSRGAPVLTFIEHGRRWVTAADARKPAGQHRSGR